MDVGKGLSFVAALVAAIGLVWTPAAAQQEGGAAKASAMKELQAKAAAGRVRVIIELRVPWQPEGALAAPEEIETSPVVASQRASIARAQGDLLSRMAGSSYASVKRFKYTPHMAMSVDRRGLDALARSPDVISIVEDELARPNLYQSIPLIGGDASLGFEDSGFCCISGAGEAVAILDTGVQKSHPFLSGKVVSEACYSTNSRFPSTSLCPGQAPSSTAPNSGLNCAASIDGCDHGTHVAGIAAGKTTNISGSLHSGVAKDASIISIQVFSSIGNTAWCGGSLVTPCTGSFTSDQIDGLERVYELRDTFRIAAANMSLGGGANTGFCDTDSRKAIIDQLRSVGIATTISSGNSGGANFTGAPGCISSAITVGSTTKSDNVSSFSNNSQTIVDVLAPGSSIRSSIPTNTFAFFNGTSMAAPHVAGAFAVLKAKNPGASVGAIEAALESTGRIISENRAGFPFSKPRIDVDLALAALAPPLLGNDVLAGFLSGAGFWARVNNASAWTLLNSQSPGAIVNAKMDGNLLEEVVADFGPGVGTWILRNNAQWEPLSSTSAQDLLTANLDGNGLDEVVVDFGPAGLWARFNDASWTSLNSASPTAMTAGNLDNSGVEEVVVSFPSSGTWIWRNNSAWEKMHGTSAENLMTADLDSDGRDEVIVDFGASAGLWAYLNDSSWMLLNSQSPQVMTVADMDGNGVDEIVADFGVGVGLWTWRNNSAWTALNSQSARDLSAADTDGNGMDEVIVDFGPGLGLWARLNDSSWQLLNGQSTETLGSGDIDAR